MPGPQQLGGLGAAVTLYGLNPLPEMAGQQRMNLLDRS